MSRTTALGTALWLLALLIEVGSTGVAVWVAGPHGPALVAVVLNVLVAARFAMTLRPGADPLISRYARYDAAGLPTEAEAYTRRLTTIWALLLAAFALLHATAVLDAWTTTVIAWIEAVCCVMFFLTEHLLRSLLFPQLGRATPWRTLRAIQNFYTR